MNLDDYQKICLQGLAIKEKSAAALFHRTLGLCGKAGAISHAMKKVVRDQDGQLTAANKAALEEKLGDTLFYLVGLADAADISLEAIMIANAKKTKQFIKTRKL